MIVCSFDFVLNIKEKEMKRNIILLIESLKGIVILSMMIHCVNKKG
jgi:hypothetical protein